jgi:hypothetical protein
MDLTKFPLDMQVCPLYIGERAEGYRVRLKERRIEKYK